MAWQHQRIIYDLMTRCSWETVKAFAQNDRQHQGIAGAITVLHTHSRRLDYLPHSHLVMPAAVIDEEQAVWRTKNSKGQDTRYLFNHKALANVFRAKLLEAIRQEGLSLPASYPETWVVDVKYVGSGEKALVYLGRYLYKGVIQEKDIVACKDGQVTFRYQDSKTRQICTRTLPGAKFLWLILRHVLPKGFRRARNFGFLHPNSKRLLSVLQDFLSLNLSKAVAWLRKRPELKCPCCGGIMRIVKTRIPPFTAVVSRPTG